MESRNFKLVLSLKRNTSRQFFWQYLFIIIFASGLLENWSIVKPLPPVIYFSRFQKLSWVRWLQHGGGHIPRISPSMQTKRDFTKKENENLWISSCTLGLGCLGVLRSILLKYHGWCVEAGVVKKRVTQGRWRGGPPTLLLYNSQKSPLIQWDLTDFQSFSETHRDDQDY